MFSTPKGHAVLRSAEPPESPTPALELPRLGLTVLDQLAASAFASGDVAQLLDQVRARAEALVGPDRDGARLRMLSRRIASCEAQTAVLETMLGPALGRRDFDAVHELEALLKTHTARLLLLLREHGYEGTLGRRSVVVLRQTELAAIREG